MMQVFLMAIGGGTGAGKTTLANTLQEQLGTEQVSILHTDTFFRAGSSTHNRPECIDEPQLQKAVCALRRGEAAHIPARGNRPERIVEARAVTVVEGHLSLCFPWLLELVDLSIYVDMDDEERLLRRIERNVGQHGQEINSVTSWYRQDVLHNHRRFTAPTKAAADLILWGDWNPRRLSRVLEIVRSLAGLD